MKKNKASKTIQDVNEISLALKENSEMTLKSIMNEAISNIINESEDDEEDDEPKEEMGEGSEDDYEVEDVETNDETEDADMDSDMDSEEDSDFDGEDAEDDVDMDEFKVGDNDFDLSGADGETALKVFNKLGDDDKIFVKDEGNGKYIVDDEETGAQYEIEIDADAIESSVDADDFDGEDEDVEFDIDLDDEGDMDGEDFDIDLDGEDEGCEGGECDLDDEGEDFEIELDGEDDMADESEDFDDDEEIEFELEDDDDDEEELMEDKNFMDWNYQGGTAMTMPAANKKPLPGTRDWGSEGAPQGDEKPYAKSKGDSKPFKDSVNENGSGFNALKHTAKTGRNTTGKGRKTSKRNYTDSNMTVQSFTPSEEMNESLKKIIKKAREIQLENKQYKVCIEKIKSSLKEAAVLNVTLGQVVKLLSENTTTSAEKKSIVQRFNNVKTIKESKNLYETIKRELNENKKSSNVVLERQISAKPYNTLNETTIYRNEANSNPSLDLMNRMDNLYK